MDGSDVSGSPLPKTFLDFLSQNGLSPSLYAASSQSIPRYVRLKPGFESHIGDIEDEIGCNLVEVPWLPNFYHLPPEIRIASTKAYREGKIYGIDAASGAAVLALNVSHGDHVLDLCAAPGAKLCMVADLLEGSGSLTGVDIARHRLAATRNILNKYALGDRCRLFVADGTKFSLIPLRASSSSNSSRGDASETYKEWEARRRAWKERKLLAKTQNKCTEAEIREDPEVIFYGPRSGMVGRSKASVYRVVDEHQISDMGYDKVLVDAECTHDGSIKHIRKFEQWGWTTLPQRVLEARRSDELSALQLNLLTNGFRLLKAGGSLVYSTCSLSAAQNEDVVERFMSRNPSAGKT
ncbi:hypothetical protein M569_13869 [Genlisea aurea]|uniref:SAM-dependent MTase RsmB/NOP-type domain-containing protein n=1 Tax=Genlisea aurea TaxID=192259 RepID=S8C9B3_9LAMI|nr:hypothetical protein M569_13869 [Genlisea aurea]